MADATQSILSIVVTDRASKLSDLAISDKQMIFASDKRVIALDYGGQRKFFNQIETLSTEQERESLESPIEGLFYFVIKSAVLWAYNNGTWIQITSSPTEDILFIGTEIPELGTERTLYVDKVQRRISVWDVESNSYIVVSEVSDEVTKDDINNLFNQ